MEASKQEEIEVKESRNDLNKSNTASATLRDMEVEIDTDTGMEEREYENPSFDGDSSSEESTLSTTITPLELPFRVRLVKLDGELDG